MIEIIDVNGTNFHLNFSKDPDLLGQNQMLVEQLYALVMGWA